MMKRILVTGLLACCLAGCGQNTESPDAGGAGGATPPPPDTTSNSTTGNTTSSGNTTDTTSTAAQYPESTEGLKTLITDILTATKDGDKEKASTLIKGLMLTNHEAWFKQTFGDEKGATLSADYAKFLGKFEPQASEGFAEMVKKGQTDVKVDRFDKAGDAKATGAQNDALKAMKSPTALYSVRLTKPGEDLGMHLWSFVYVDGGFRFVNKLN